MLVVASQTNPCGRMWEAAQKRRAAVEQSRANTVRRLHEDIQRIARRETEFAKKLVDDLVPVRVIVDERALKDLQDRVREMVPIHVEVVDEVKKEEAVEPEVMP